MNNIFLNNAINKKGLRTLLEGGLSKSEIVQLLVNENYKIGLGDFLNMLDVAILDINSDKEGHIVNENVKTTYHSHTKPTQSVILTNSRLRYFVKNVIDYFYKKDKLKSTLKYYHITSRKRVNMSDIFTFNLKGMFLESSINEIRDRNTAEANQFTQRWFEDKYILNNREHYLSTQWYGRGDYQLLYSDFCAFIKACYGHNYRIAFEEDKYKLIKTV